MNFLPQKLNFLSIRPFFLLFLALWQVAATHNSAAKNISESELAATPIISLRCRELLNERTEKIGVRQKTYALKRRVENLQKKLDIKLKSKRKKIAFILRKITTRKDIIEYELANLEEEIVRKGCPGIKF